jgi:hypothetical protein
MFEQVGRMWRRSLSEQQAGGNKAVERRLEFRLRFACHRSH